MVMRTVFHSRRQLSATVVVATALLIGCGRSERAPAAERPQPVNVRVATAAMLDRPERFEAGGVVAAAETAVVSSRVVAPVTAVAVRPGDRVRAGDVLVRLDAREMAARARQAGAATRAAEEALVAARSTQAAAAAEQTLATAWHTRIAQLRERNAVTAQEFDEAAARLAGATARTAAAAAGIEQAAAQLAALRAGGDVAAITESYTLIRAPFDGEVTERFTDPGNLASPGQPLLRIDATGGRRVDVGVDEARAGYVRPGDRVAVLLGHGAGKDAALAGTVVEVGRAIAADARAFTVKVALPRDVGPRTGTFARVRFDGAPRRALVVPVSAVRVQGHLTSVFVVSQGVARIRLVQTGVTDTEGTEILAGLDAGESVVIDPPAALTDGRAVTIATAPAATGG
ncbi:MAG TPA: efflux RND transporter periplasmic adaptor subunit [Vicinamibacterales bacterium]|jgi:RND family efflux transporter MFP subunit|nr:efflux RND transporter periplasmic adaptor subunit [Vicinamibacterales bacterium]